MTSYAEQLSQIADARSDAGFCAGDSVQIDGSPTGSGTAGPYTYSWSPATGLNATDIANPTASAADTFTINVTDANGCWDTDDVIVTETVCTALDPTEKTDSLIADADGDGYYSAGDTILYEVTIWNEGTIDATGVVFTDTPDPNTTLVTGSVATSKGSVTTGNNPGDTSISVTVGTLLAGGPATETITISFHVRINDPLPTGVHHIYNQGLFTHNEGPPEPTDDPDTDPDDDPTVTPIIQGPPAQHVPVFPSMNAGLAAALGTGVLAYLYRMAPLDGERRGYKTNTIFTRILGPTREWMALLLSPCHLPKSLLFILST